MTIRQLILLVVFSVWLPAVVGFGLLGWYQYNQESAAVRKQVEDFALSTGKIVEQDLDKRAVLARTLAATQSAREMDLPRFHSEAKKAVEDADSWAILVTQDELLVHTLMPYNQQPTPRSKRTAMARDLPITLYVPHGAIASRPIVSVLAPVPDDRPQPLNVGISFDPSVFQNLLLQRPLPFGSVASIVNDEAIVVARSRDPQKYVGQIATDRLRLRISKGDIGFEEAITREGIPSLLYLTNTSTYGWSVVVAVPKQRLTAAALNASGKALTASALLLLFGLAAALFGARKINRVVRELRESAVLLGKGGVPPATSSGVREIDEVHAALHSAGVDASQATAVLERRVEEAVKHTEQAQARLLHKHKLEIVGNLTSGVSHDFNNFLQTVSAGLHVLSREPVSDRARQAIEGSLHATKRAGELVRQLMSLSRIQQLEPSPVDIAQVTDKVGELVLRALGERIVLSIQLELNLPRLFVDATQLEVSLMNLLFNARDALAKGGNIIVRVRAASAREVAALADGDYLCIEVEDNGTGMPAEVKARAFDPYFTTKPDGVGTGIGLAQVFGFAKQSGGDVVIDSVVGEGTRVSLYLPVATQRATGTAPSDPGVDLLT